MTENSIISLSIQHTALPMKPSHKTILHDEKLTSIPSNRIITNPIYEVIKIFIAACRPFPQIISFRKLQEIWHGAMQS